MNENLNQNLGCLGAILRLFGVNFKPEAEKIRFDGFEPEEAEALPYRLRDDFLSAAELSFYHALRIAIGADVVVCSKVNLADVFFVVKPNENQAYRNKIDRKHVDFLLCNAKSMRPLVGIELDDASHKRADRQERDEFVDSVFAAAELPLIHVPARASYSISELTAMLTSHFDQSAQPVAHPNEAAKHTETVPMCDKCGIPMVLRTATRSGHQGNQFWGCANYPKCRKVVPLAGETATA